MKDTLHSSEEVMRFDLQSDDQLQGPPSLKNGVPISVQELKELQ